MDQNPQSQLKLLIAQGKEQGYLTYAEVNDSLPEELTTWVFRCWKPHRMPMI